MSTFWSLWIIILTVINLALLFWVLMANRKVAVSDEDDPENRTTGHVYDGIEEYDNPLPRWWFMMFLATFVFSIIYLAAYPGLGSYKGFLGWTSTGELANDQAKAQESYEKTFGKYIQMPIEELAQDPKAMKMGTRLFANNCAVCHGADGGGAFGFPNLTDHDWIYGGTPEAIKTTLINGRQAAMPAWGDILGEEKIAEVAQFVLSLSGRAEDDNMVTKGKEIFAQNCATCHGADAKGLVAMGAPNLTDDIWLYGGDPAEIRQTLRSGRNGMMPSQADKLREDKIHLLTAYVYSLSLDAPESK
ncbi:cytochrome-c oxidase, cbb3-type subunit III [Marinibactrum halimedae]|uniref:Cbb3-type cytochrome c oxidase subunit n=1 Tax=Marinibactrum halimedae TaxID=1444977 RepID=A0AA37T3P9_9GAMM|nr:cytochrome-c oxidase, cbb3-type subunit III [Marinibactrum halimedae]MCD9457917.1 cytochrome-c oxidase, cbb3-type subunit III [Marinibactrum halimedae]GLS26258.1 Cbb3-type cytochrome c oxidase subunit [Marinibactrum halimedae]